MPLTPVVHYAERHPNRVVIAICSLLLINTLVGVFAYYKVTQNTEELRTQSLKFANLQCETSNKARGAVYDILDFAEHRVKTIPNNQQTEKQKKQAIQFYEDAKKKIIFIQCPSPLP